MSPTVINTLKAWRPACPQGPVDLVFPNTLAKVEPPSNLTHRVWRPLQRAIGLIDGTGERLFNFHAPRHFAASWMIELGLSPKRLQALLGHSSVEMTFDRYGHLFPSAEDDHERFARGEAGLVASVSHKRASCTAIAAVAAGSFFMRPDAVSLVTDSVK